MDQPNTQSELRPSVARMRHHDLPSELEDLARRVIGLAIEVHRTLGPGLLEGIYEEALAYELTRAGIAFERQKPVEIAYKDTILRGQRIDFLINEWLVIELKSISQLIDLNTAQTLGYLRAIDSPLGLLMNFNAVRLTDGLKRVLNARWSGLKEQSHD